MDKSLHGYKKELDENPVSARAKADAIIRNTYRTLMTRGMKGCYIYCEDAETAAHFRRRVAKENGDESLRMVADESGPY
jgi:DUF2075 family protein